MRIEVDYTRQYLTDSKIDKRRYAICYLESKIHGFNAEHGSEFSLFQDTLIRDSLIAVLVKKNGRYYDRWLPWTDINIPLMDQAVIHEDVKQVLEDMLTFLSK